MSQVLVVGHKNPDTDSICAAIAYAYLKNQISDDEYIAMKAGKLNEETSYVLDRFSMEEPPTIEDVGAQIRDIDFRHTQGVDGHISLKKAWEMMREKDVVTLPIVGESGRLEGVIVNGDIAYSYMDVYDNSILARARTQYKNIIETLNGTLVTGNDHAYFTKGKVVVASGNSQVMRDEIEEDDLVILGNISSRQKVAIEEKASCVIICNTIAVEDEILELAKEHECVIITTEYDCFTTARLIHQSMPIKYFMTKKDIITFDLDDYIDEVRDTMGKVRHRDFPVLDSQRRYVGMISRRLLLNMQKKQIILVDHNEKTQTVDNIDQADVLEIIDHHRLGSLETVSPIFFRNQPLGSVSTIIAIMYEENDVKMPKDIAGILLSAIISDTLMFRSPTCTPMDKKVAKKLAEIADINIEEHAMAMFEAGSDFKNRTIEEIFYQDFKVFSLDDRDFGVAQISAVSRKQLDTIKEQLLEYMNTVLGAKSLDMVFIMLTDIFEQDTELLYLGHGAGELAAKAFGFDEVRPSFMLSHVVSRKKQLIPPIIEAIEEF